jgi:hypothetical protein
MLQCNTRRRVLPDATGAQIPHDGKDSTMAAPQISAEHPPQILHWLARKAAMPLDRAKAAWRRALRDAGRSGAAPASAEYWKLAADGLVHTMAAETLELHAAPFGFGPLLRLPARLWLLGLTSGEAIAVAGTRRWQAAWWHHGGAH